MLESTVPALHAAQPVLLRQDNRGVSVLTLNRPEHFNALSEELLASLQNELSAIASDDSVRVVVLAAKGRAFCAGHDLKEMRANPSKDYYQTLFNRCGRLMLTIQGLPQPVIARVHGIATAAGCQLVGACDLAVAAEEARFAVSGINVGLFCSTPAVALSRNVGVKPALEMLLTGEFVSAQRARELGLINRVVSSEALDEALDQLIEAILCKSPLAIRVGKHMFYRQLEMGTGDAYMYASEVMSCNMLADDAMEGIDAFMHKRAPVWKGS